MANTQQDPSQASIHHILTRKMLELPGLAPEAEVMRGGMISTPDLNSVSPR